jgi:hypothetical protein
MGFPTAVKEEALVRSRRHCCLCHKFAGLYTNVHHIEQEADGGPNDLDNAVVLCLECHGQVGHYNARHPIGDKYRPSEVKRHRNLWWEWCKDNPFAPIATDPTSGSRQPLKIVRTFPASIVFNEAENLPQIFFDMDGDIGQRLASKSSIARPYDNIEGKTVLMVEVPITDDQKFLHGVDALQCKMLVDICRAQRGSTLLVAWSASKGHIPTKITMPNTPEPISRLPGTVILDALAENRFAQNNMIRVEFEYSQIPFPDGASIRLEARPSQPGVGTEQRRVVLAVPGKATIIVSVEPLGARGAGALPQGWVHGEALEYCRMFTFSVRIDAEIIRSGSHDDVIQDYKPWIEWLATELESHNAD